MSFTIFENSNGKILLFLATVASLDGVFSLRENKSHSTFFQRLFRLFYNFFFTFYFLNQALQSDNNSNAVYVIGHKYVLGPSQSSF